MSEGQHTKFVSKVQGTLKVRDTVFYGCLGGGGALLVVALVALVVISRRAKAEDSLGMSMLLNEGDGDASF
jgi:hypothetical protein